MSLKITTEATGLLDMVNLQYGPVLNVNDCVNQDYTTFGSATPTSFNATSDGSGNHQAGTADEIPIVDTRKYVVSFDLVLNSGTAPFYAILSGFGGTDRTVEGQQLSVNGGNAFEFTGNLTQTCLLEFKNDNTATNFEITNLSIRQVL